MKRKLTGAPKNLGADPFPDPVSHYGAPWRPIGILQMVQCCVLQALSHRTMILKNDQNPENRFSRHYLKVIGIYAHTESNKKGFLGGQGG